MIIPGVLNGGLTLIGPAADGSDGQFLKTNGSGVLSFDDAGGGSGPNLFPNYTAPVDGDFAWINQGGAAISVADDDSIALYGPTPGASYSLRIRKKAAPATPYTITAAFLGVWNFSVTGNLSQFGLIWRQASDGKCITHAPMLQSNTSGGSPLSYWAVQKWTNPTTFSAAYSGERSNFPPVSPVLWLRITDNGTNRICSFSADGINFIASHTVGRTDFLTADEVGFFVNAYSADVTATLLHWRQT